MSFYKWESKYKPRAKNTGKPVDLETSRKSARDYRAQEVGLRPSHVW